MKKFKIVDGMFVTKGIFLVALLRLIFIPFGLTCYFLAVTSIEILAYMIGTIFYLFKIMLIVLIGCSIYEASETNQEGGEQEIILLVLEIVFTVLITIWITCWAKNVLEKKFEEAEREEKLLAKKM